MARIHCVHPDSGEDPQVKALAMIGLGWAPALWAGSFDCTPPLPPVLSNPVVLGNGTAGSVSRAQLQAALDAGGAIRLQIGSSTLVLDATLQITRAVTLDGGGARLSGGLARRVIEIRNPQLASFDVTLMNLQLIEGDARTAVGDPFARSGGAILNDHGSEPWRAVGLRVFDVMFSGNRAIDVAQDGGGGGVYLIGHREFVCVRCTFADNLGSNGGGMYLLGTQTIRFYDTRFDNNRATGDGGNPGNGGNGGALAVDGDTRELSLCRTTLAGNHANAYGAGLFTTVYDQTSITRIWQSSLIGNLQDGNDQHTGGAYIQGGPVSIHDSTFAQNEANGYGGLALFDHQTGSGLITVGGEIVSSTFVGNMARNGLGGAMNLQGTAPLLLQNLTIAGNRALCSVCFAGGIANGSNRPITLRNSIFYDNTGGNAFNPWALLNPIQGGSNNLQYPRERPGSFGQQELPVTPDAQFLDALLSPLADNGGPTLTMALQSTSPAINAGTATGAPSVDQRGLPRFGAVDIGAYEAQGGIWANGFE
ncbi:MAG: choice-of-anchor Q domain-containing protein [Lysobacterales bacterium]